MMLLPLLLNNLLSTGPVLPLFETALFQSSAVFDLTTGRDSSIVDLTGDGRQSPISDLTIGRDTFVMSVGEHT